MPEPSDASPVCLNCGHAFGDAPRLKYCPACGQETNLRPPTLAEFAQQFGGSIVATEGALWRTLVLLFTKPGQLTLEYLAGRRRRYLLPLRLYLTVSLVAFLALRLGTALQVNVDPADAQLPIERVDAWIDMGSARAGLRGGKFFCENYPDWVCRRLQRRFDVDPKVVAREVEEASQRFVGHWGSAMFALVPLFAAWTRLAWSNRRLRYSEHLVFALHLHSFWFAAIALMQILPGAFGAIPLLAIPVYALLAAQRVFRGRWWVTLARNLAVAIAYAASLMLALAVVSLWTLIG